MSWADTGRCVKFIFIRKPKWKNHFRSLRLDGRLILKICPVDIGSEYGLDLSGEGWGPVVGCIEHSK
jgi:hypothetical protein